MLLLKYNKDTNIIDNFMKEYISKNNVLNTLDIRHFVGDPFTLNIQQDAAEFLTALCAKLTILRDVMKCNVSITVCCTKCNYTNTEIQMNYVIPLVLPSSLPKKSVELEYIIKYNFSRWSSIEGKCNTCQESGTLLTKQDISSANQIIVLHLALFDYSKEGTCKITNYNIKGVPNAQVPIASNLYKVSSAIFHHGNNLHEGHFTNMLRDKSKPTKWIHADDETILYKPWPRNSKDAYILFLEQFK